MALFTEELGKDISLKRGVLFSALVYANASSSEMMARSRVTFGSGKEGCGCGERSKEWEWG
jgi:hypothetical protein